MRFHVGFSFRLKNLVKFIIPILIGIGAYFGLPVLFGFIPKANALVNLNTSYDFTINEDLSSSLTDTYNTIIEDLKDNQNGYTFAINYKGTETYIYSFPKLSFTSVYVYKEYSYVGFHINNETFFYLHFDNSTDIINTTEYQQYLTCYTTGDFNNCFSISNNDIYFGNGSASPFVIAIGLGNDDNFSATLDQYYYYIESPQYYYIDSNNSSNSDVFYKSLYINGELIEEGDPFPTYYSLFIGSDEPIPPEPEESTIVDSIYWFTDNITEYDILVNIYILLFLYCISMIVLKLLMIVKGVKW